MENSGEQGKKIVPGKESEQAEDSTFRNQGYQSWIDDAYSEFEKKGGLETLIGKGKPLNLQSGDPMGHVLKEANVLPGWLKLQHEIRDLIKELISSVENKQNLDMALAIKDINNKIAKYNNLVPIPILQKMKISAHDFTQQYNKWL